MYRITIELTMILRLMSLKYLLDIRYASSHIKLYKNMRNTGSVAAKNILNMTEFGANAFKSLPSTNQSNETKDSDDDPIISPGINTS